MLQTIPDALAPLSAYRQFCLYKTAPHPNKPGKLQKFPCDTAGNVRSAHDPSIWMTFSEAVECARQRGAPFGVAFVLTAVDPFFFLDIDGCYDEQGRPSQIAVDLCAAFAGCAVEISTSGRGLHIIGAGAMGSHSCTNRKAKSYGLELYTDLRFIALTGTAVQGRADFAPRPEVLQWVVSEFFPAGAEREDATGQEWTDGPVEEWNGPADDAELIRRACASVSANAAFGVSAAFFDLWSGNADVLSRIYPPDPSSPSMWNGSSADMALAAHLAFWTGKDCARIERLMRESALARDKYDRGDYLERTILTTVANTAKVLEDRLPEVPNITLATSQNAAPQFAAARVIEGSTFLTPEQQIEIFAGCVYVRDQNRILVPSGEMLKREVFNATYGGYQFVMDRSNGKVSRDPWEAFTQSQVVRHTQVQTTCFRPSLAFGAIVAEEAVTMVNTFFPVEIYAKPGDAGLFLRHLAKLIPDERDREILLAYMCACVQHIGVKFKWTPLIQGVEGNGKTVLSLCVAYAIGKRYVHWPKASKLTNQFNKWMLEKLFYAVEDIYTPRNKIENFEELKTMITGDDLEIEGKGADQISREICGNFMLNSNHKGAINKTANDRRIAPFFTAQQQESDLRRDHMGGDYMSELFDWLNGVGDYASHGRNHGFAIVADLLRTRPIPPELNPAGKCKRAPITTSTQEAIGIGMGTIEQYVLDCVDRGDTGFRGGFISSKYLDELMERKGRQFKPSERDNIMRTVGYVRHPGLERGRVNNPILPDAARSILYVRPDSEAAKLIGRAILQAYQTAQEEKAIDSEVNNA